MSIQFPATIELKINQQPQKFQLDFNICQNPDCDCNGVSMFLYNENNEIQFFFDFATISHKENNYSEKETEIIRALIDFLKSNEHTSLNTGFFEKQYAYVKEKVKRKRDEINSFKPGMFMLYNDILWAHDDLQMKIDEKNYIIFESYCVMPNCSCTDVALHFFEEVHKLEETRQPDFEFVYNYTTHIYRDVRGTNDAQIKNITNIITESMNNILKKRHKRLKKELKTDIEREIKKTMFIQNESGKRKLGRNELCHCGSGKKYKKCCLDKDIEKYGRAIKVD